MRTRYLSSRPEFTELMLLDSGIGTITSLRSQLEQKVRRLKVASALLAAAGAFFAAGTMAEVFGG